MNPPLKLDPTLTTCPICQSNQIVPHKTDYTGIHIDQCKTCKIEFMNPQYTDEYLQAFYDQYQSKLTKTHKFGDDTKPRELIHHYNLTEIEMHCAPGRFLSVGCGKGIDLLVAQQRGWDAEGYDVDPVYTAKQSEETGLPIHSGVFTKLDLPNEGYDCIYLNHVLEHPKNPGAYLKVIQRLLKPGGILYIACPNIRSLSHRVKSLTEALRLRKQVAKHYDTWQHLFFYSPNTLGQALQTHYTFDVLYSGSDIKARPGEDAVRVPRLASLGLKSTFRLIARKRP